MPTVQQWSDLLTQVKDEGEITSTDTTYDAFLLAAANESLYEACSRAADKRDFRIEVPVVMAGTNPVTIGDYYIHNIEKVSYTRASTTLSWELSEESGIVCPAPYDLYASAYKSFATNTAAAMTTTLKLYPVPGASGDTLTLLGTGFKQVLATTTYLPFLAFIPYIKARLLQRLQMRRNLPLDRIKVYTENMTMTAQLAGMAANDESDLK